MIPINEEYILLCPKEPSARALGRIMSVVDNLNGEGIVSFDYFLKKGTIKQHVHCFINMYSVLERYCNPPYLVLLKRYFQDGVSKHQMVCDALLASATVKHVHEPYGTIDIEDYYDMDANILKTMNGYYSREFHYGELIGKYEHESKTLVLILSSNVEFLYKALVGLSCDIDRDKMEISVGWYGDIESWKLMRCVCKSLIDDMMFIDRNIYTQFNFSLFNNLLYCRCVNRNHEFILLLNDDVWDHSVTFSSELIRVSHTESAAIVGAKLLYADSNKYQHGGVKLGDDVTLFEHVGRHVNNGSIFLPTREVSAVTFAAALIKRQLYDTQKLDEHYYGDCNDIEYCLKARESRYRIWYCSTASAVHAESATRRNDLSMQNDDNSRIFYRQNINRLRKEFIYT